MAYCTLSDILGQISESKLIQLTDDDDAGAVDTDFVDQAIADADAEIDGYCGVKYSVPFETVPALIRKYSVDISIYNIYARRVGADDDRQKRYDNAIRFLRDVSAGKVSLGENDPDGSPAELHTPEMSSSNPDRIFSRDKMSGF